MYFIYWPHVGVFNNSDDSWLPNCSSESGCILQNQTVGPLRGVFPPQLVTFQVVRPDIEFATCYREEGKSGQHTVGQCVLSFRSLGVIYKTKFLVKVILSEGKISGNLKET